MINLSHQSGSFLKVCITTGFCTVLFVSVGSSSAHAPTSTYADEKILCVVDQNFPHIQFSKGKVDFRHSELLTSAEARTLKPGDTIYTGIDGFVSLQISANQSINVSPLSQVRIETTSDECQMHGLPGKEVEFTRATTNTRSQSGNS